MTLSTKNTEVVVKCMGCGTKRNIGPGEIAESDHPMCERCFMPMVAVSATTLKKKVSQ